MKVLHVIPSVSLQDGGPSVAMLGMAAALAARGVQVTVATTDADGAGRLDVPLGVPVTSDGVDYLYFARSLPGAYKYSWPLTRWLYAHAGEFDVAHVHALFSYATIPGCRAARRAGVPYLLRPLGTLNAWSLAHRRWKKTPYMAMVERRHLRDAAALHATSDAEGASLAALGYGDKVSVIPLGVSLRPRGQRSAPVDDELRLLFLSRLHPKKGLPLLFDALKLVTVEGSRAVLTVAGAGTESYEAELRALVAARGLDGRVRFVGHLDGAEKDAAFEAADAFVLPSSDENFGIAVAEALARGLPVIVSDQVAIAGDVERAGAGMVVPLDAAALAAGIRRLGANGGARRAMEAAALRLAAERYSWARTATLLTELYAELASTAAAGGPTRWVSGRRGPTVGARRCLRQHGE